MTNPTLSFMHRSRYSSGDNVSLVISDGVSQTPFVFTTIYYWQHEWIDVSEWTGKTITVTFRSPTTEDLFYLDEVTLSSAHPNVWVDLRGDLAALPGEEVNYEVRFGNDTNLDADRRRTQSH